MRRGIELTPGMTMTQHASIQTIAILPDGDGGMFVLTRQKSPYEGHGGFWYPDQYYLHRRATDGTTAPGWANEGVRLETPYLDPRYVGLHLPRMVSDAVPADGGWVWANYHTAIAATSDGESGAILAWAGAQGADLNIVAARVAPGGRLPWRRDMSVCSAPGEQSTVACAGWDEDGALVAWRDGRRGADVGFYVQAIGNGGRARWAADGIAVGVGTGERGPVRLESDGREGAYLVWGDATAGGEVFAQRLLHSGRPAPGWPDNGWLVSHTAEPDYDGSIGLSLVEGRCGTAIAAWQSWRKGSFAMLVTPRGPAASVEVGRGKPRAAPIENASTLETGTKFAILGIHPNPMATGGTVRFALPGSAPAALELFDIAGRRVWSREVGALGPGEHDLPLSGGSRLPAGVYVVRLAQGGRIATARAISLR